MATAPVPESLTPGTAHIQPEKRVTEALQGVTRGASALGGRPLAQVVASLLNNRQGDVLAGLIEPFRRSGLGPQRPS